jgi:pectate lyase
MLRFRLPAAAPALALVCAGSLWSGCASSGSVDDGTGGGAGAGGTTVGAGGSGGNQTAGSGGSTGSGGSATGSGGSGAGTGGSTGAGGATGAGGSTGAGGAVTTGAGGAGGTMSTSSCTGTPTPPSQDAVIGWASQAGMGQNGPTTGGGTTTPVLVTTAQAFTSNITGTAAKVIYVMGTITGQFGIGSNKTIVGVCGGEIHGHLEVSRGSNVIVRNLKITGYGVGDCSLDPTYTATVGCSSGLDAVTIQNNSHHVWFDHDDISDGTDGNLDVTSGSDFVTVSWTKFHYTPRTDNVGNDSTGAEGHRFSNLIGSADNVPGDVGHLNVTWHHNWWAENVNQRMPRTRAGKIHMLNNLFTSTGNSVCTNAGQGATLLVEGNAYIGVKGPLQITTGGTMLAPATGPNVNLFQGTSGGTTTATGPGFTPPYTYSVDPASGISAAVMAGAGSK